MKFRTAISILVAAMLALTSMASYAGNGRGGGGGAADRTHQADRDRSYDRDRTFDRDRMRDRTRVEEPRQDRVRDQDRTHMQDPANMSDQDIYGNQLMSVQERKQYRQQLGVAETQQQRNELQAQHEQRMQERALQQGQDLVPPGQGPVYGGELMSVQERNQFREQMRLAGSEEERQRLMAQHRDRIHQRAQALDIPVEDSE